MITDSMILRIDYRRYARKRYTLRFLNNHKWWSAAVNLSDDECHQYRNSISMPRDNLAASKINLRLSGRPVNIRFSARLRFNFQSWRNHRSTLVVFESSPFNRITEVSPNSTKSLWIIQISHSVTGLTMEFPWPNAFPLMKPWSCSICINMG